MKSYEAATFAALRVVSVKVPYGCVLFVKGPGKAKCACTSRSSSDNTGQIGAILDDRDRHA